jgi:hypothetical protein
VIIREKTPERVVFVGLNSAAGKYNPVDDPCPEYPLPEIEAIRGRLAKDLINRQRITPEPITLHEFEVTNAVDFFMRVGDLAVLGRMVAANSTAALNEVGARIPLGLAQECKVTVEGRVSRKMEELVGEKPSIRRDTSGNPIEVWSPSLGINFIRSSVKDWGHPHTLNTAIKLANESEFNKQTTITASEGERVAIQNRGRANADAEGWLLEERGKGLGKMAEVATSGPGGIVAIQTDAMVRAMQSGNTNIISVDPSSITGALAGAASILKGGDNNPLGGAPNPPKPPTPKPGNKGGGQKPPQP